MDLIISSATHRSGSTLLQRMFNSRKKTIIWGEHLGCLQEFCEIYDKVITFSVSSRKERKKYFGSGENPNHWIPRLTPEENVVQQSILEATRLFFNTLYASNNHDIIGFKEVRYGKKELTLFRECFPKCKIILLVRNPIDSWRSLSNTKWNKDTINDYIIKWNNNVSFYQELSNNDSNAVLVKYEDIVNQDKETINLILEFGKLEWKDIDKVLGKKIGSTNKKKLVKREVSLIKKKCNLNMSKLGYLQ